jgi:hypothetical protein
LKREEKASKRAKAASKLNFNIMEVRIMTVKFNQYWTIISDEHEEYAKFMIRNFIPGMNSLGLHVVAAWSVLVGAYSEIFFESVSNDLSLIESALMKPKFKELNENLYNYIKNYKTKILIPTGRKDSYSMDIKENTIKFIQSWDIISRKKTEYEHFVTEEFYPCLEKFGITIAGEWEVLIGGGPHIICEGRVDDIDSLIKNLQSKKFRKARRNLKSLVENFECRIFSFHIHKVRGYKSASYALWDV